FEAALGPRPFAGLDGDQVGHLVHRHLLVVAGDVDGLQRHPGSSGGRQVTARAALMRPWPYSSWWPLGSYTTPPILSHVSFIRCTTWARVRVGNRATTRAATPAASGVA